MRPHFLPRAIVAMLLVLAMTGGAWAQGNPTGTVVRPRQRARTAPRCPASRSPRRRPICRGRARS